MAFSFWINLAFEKIAFRWLILNILLKKNDMNADVAGSYCKMQFVLQILSNSAIALVKYALANIFQRQNNSQK